MKLSVICSENRLQVLPDLRNILDGLFVETLTWYNDHKNPLNGRFDELDRCLEYSPYHLCIIDTEDFDSLWIHYVMGYQRSRTDRLAFLVTPGNLPEIPEWASRYQLIVGDCHDVYRHYADVELTWGEETKPVLARKAIAKQNLEVSARSYIEAIQNGDRFLLGLFLDAGFSPSLRDSAGVPVLNMAIRRGHLQLVGPLLSAGADLNSVAEDRDTTPLMDAAASGYTELTEALINAGALLEHTNRDGQTAVTLAVGNGKETTATVLIGAGADVDKVDSLGMSARKYAKLYNQKLILDAIAKYEHTH